MVAIADTVAAAPRRPRNATLHFFVRLFRDKPLGAFGFVVCVIFLFLSLIHI